MPSAVRVVTRLQDQDDLSGTWGDGQGMAWDNDTQRWIPADFAAAGDLSWLRAGTTVSLVNSGDVVVLGTDVAASDARLDVRGPIAATTDAETPDTEYNGALIATRGATRNQFINLIRAASRAWSLGMVGGPTVNTLGIGASAADDSLFAPHFRLDTSGRMAIGPVGGTSDPYADAALDLQDPTRGLLLNRLADATAMDDAAGMLAYDTGRAAAMVNNGADWRLVATAAVGASADLASYEPALGSPSVSGQVLASTDAGVRSWVSLPDVPASEPPLGNPASDGYALISTAAGARSWGTREPAMGTPNLDRKFLRSTPTGVRYWGDVPGLWGAAASTQPANIPDTTNASLAALEAEVNAIKAALRTVGVLASSQPYLLDRFSGADGTALDPNHDLETGETWSDVGAGTIGLSSNKAIVTPNGTSALAVVSAPWSDVTVEVTFHERPSGGSVYPCKIIGRYTDASNYWYVTVWRNGNGFRIYEVAGGTETLRAFANAPVIPDTDNTVRVTFDGATITARLGATTVECTSATSNQTAKGFGFGLNSRDTAYETYYTADNFLLWQGSGPPPPNPLYGFSFAYPEPYQIVQRGGALGDIPISGSFVDENVIHDIEAALGAGDYAVIAQASPGSFAGTLANQPQGQGTLAVRLADDVTQTGSVAHVGIGDVYVIAGQSNAVGLGANLQSYSHATLKAGLFGNDYAWRELADPVDSAVGQFDAVSEDAGCAGSYWPLLATSLLAARALPIGFVPCAKSASAIEAWLPGTDHEDRATLYGSMIYRARRQPGGVKAVLFHQGESDACVNGFTGGAAYKTRLMALADAVYADLGVPLIVARIHCWTGAPSTTQANVDEINQAMADAAAENANVVLGPNFDSPTKVTTSLHFTTNAELAAAANRWSAALIALGI